MVKVITLIAFRLGCISKKLISFVDEWAKHIWKSLNGAWHMLSFMFHFSSNKSAPQVDGMWVKANSNIYWTVCIPISSMLNSKKKHLNEHSKSYLPCFLHHLYYKWFSERVTISKKSPTLANIIYNGFEIYIWR